MGAGVAAYSPAEPQQEVLHGGSAAGCCWWECRSSPDGVRAGV